MIITFDFYGLFHTFATASVIDWTPQQGFAPAPPSTAVMEYIYFARHRHRR